MTINPLPAPPNAAQYNLSALYVYPWYQTRDDYRAATGQDAAPFDPTRPPKYWLDPEAAKSAKRSVTYANVLAVDDNGAPVLDEGGHMYTEPLVLLRSEASTLNLPAAISANEPGADKAYVQPPLRAMLPGEELATGIGGIVLVRNTVYVDPAQPAQWTVGDRALLQAIARKVGVL